MPRTTRISVLALLAAMAACDRPAPTEDEQTPAQPAAVTQNPRSAAERAGMDRLAHRLARALADPDFRGSLRAQLDHSPFIEHKLQLQSFLRANSSHALKDIARITGVAASQVESEAAEAIPLEIYFPVPAHRSNWKGGPEVLVASAREDREAPVAYDISGRRQVLSPDHPPAAPVLAVVPVETDFSGPRQVAPMECLDCSGGGGTGGGGGGGTPVPPGGLYLTYSHFVQDFEGWLKGDPEFEFHILGQSATTDSLRDYQCAGGAAGGYYHFDQNDLNWTGSALLFSQAQLNSYRTAHPNQNFRVVALEDDDTGCVIKFDSDRFKRVLATMQTQYPNLTGAKDTSNTIAKWVKRGNALQKILSAVYSFITTQDDLIGNAIEDVVVGQTYAGANWIVKGENNVTNGWIKLEMR
jgi:hypothetical protein